VPKSVSAAATPRLEPDMIWLDQGFVIKKAAPDFPERLFIIE